MYVYAVKGSYGTSTHYGNMLMQTFDYKSVYGITGTQERVPIRQYKRGITGQEMEVLLYKLNM